MERVIQTISMRRNYWVHGLAERIATCSRMQFVVEQASKRELHDTDALL